MAIILRQKLLKRSLGIKAQEHPDPGVRGCGGLPDVDLEEVVTSDTEYLEHGVITNPPENKRAELTEAPENPLEDVGLLDRDVVSLEHLDLEA